MYFILFEVMLLEIHGFYINFHVILPQISMKLIIFKRAHFEGCNQSED